MDWDAITRSWVADGLIDERQRAPLVARLHQDAPTTGLQLGALVTVLVVPACWLLWGSAVALLLLLDPPKALFDALTGGFAAVLIAGGLVLRAAPRLRPLSRGAVAAGFPLATLCAGSVLIDAAPLPEAVILLALLPASVGWGVGLLEDSRSITSTAAVAFWLATLAVVVRLEPGWLALIPVPLTCVAIAGLGAAGRRWPHRGALPVGTPLLVLTGVTLLLATPALPGTGSWLSSDRWLIEKGFAVLVFGAVVLGIGLPARAPGALVPGVLCIASSTVVIAFEIGDFVGGALALGAVSLAFFAGAIALWVLPTLRESPDDPEV